MNALQIKSIAIIIIFILTSNNIIAQDQTTTAPSLDYKDKKEFFEGQKTRALKVNFIGNFWGTSKITYEQVIRPGKSIELKATLIDMTVEGAMVSIGYKIYKEPSFVAPNMQRRNILEGTYLKPEVFVGMIKSEYLFSESQETKSTAGFLLNIGKQWTFGESIVIDTYIGTGVGAGDSLRGYFVKEGLVLTAGLNFGYAF